MIRELVRQIGNLLTWIVIVAPWEQAIRVRFGKRVTLLKAGTYLRIPFIDRVYRQSIRRRLELVPPQVLTTKDGRALSVGAAIGYAVVDMLKLYNTLHDASATIRSSVCAMIADYVANHALPECSPSDVEKSVRERLQLGRYGLGEEEFFLTNFAAVRTYRVITGAMPEWGGGNGLDTTRHDDTGGAAAI